MALSILALALASLLGTFSNGLRAVRTSDDYVQALYLAQSLLAERVSSREQEIGIRRGTFDEMVWTVRIRRTEVSEVSSFTGLNWEPFHVTVQVSWSPNREIVLQTLKLGHRRGPS